MKRKPRLTLIQYRRYSSAMWEMSHFLFDMLEFVKDQELSDRTKEANKAIHGFSDFIYSLWKQDYPNSFDEIGRLKPIPVKYNPVNNPKLQTVSTGTNRPKAFCKLHKHEPRGEKPYFTWVVSQCPICGKRHIHGAGDDEGKVEENLGHRVTDCDRMKISKTAPTSYFLVRKGGIE